MKPHFRRYSPLAALILLLALLNITKFSVNANFSITEIKAVAELSFPDNDGKPSDWIEITNTGDSSASLGGHFLTNNANDLTRWKFPAINLRKGESIIVFASAKNRINPDESA